MLITLHGSGGSGPDIRPIVDGHLIPAKGDKVRTGKGWQEVRGVAWEIDHVGRLVPTGVFLKKQKAMPKKPKGEPVVEVPLSNGEAWPITQEMIDEWAKAYPGVDVAQQLSMLRQWNLSNKSRRKTASGILDHITSWLARAQNDSGGRGGRKTSLSKLVESLIAYKSEESSARARGEDYDSNRDIWHYEIVVPSRRIEGGMKAVWEEYNKAQKEGKKHEE